MQVFNVHMRNYNTIVQRMVCSVTASFPDINHRIVQ